MFLKIIFAIIFLIGSLCIFDARVIARRFFTSSDRNIATNILKVVGFLIYALLLIFVIYKNIN